MFCRSTGGSPQAEWLPCNDLSDKFTQIDLKYYLYLGLDLREPDVELLLVVQRPQPLLVVGDLGELEEEPVGEVENLS